MTVAAEAAAGKGVRWAGGVVMEAVVTPAVGVTVGVVATRVFSLCGAGMNTCRAAVVSTPAWKPLRSVARVSVVERAAMRRRTRT